MFFLSLSAADESSCFKGFCSCALTVFTFAIIGFGFYDNILPKINGFSQQIWGYSNLRFLA